MRCKPEFTEAIFEDLGWLGFTWEQPVRKQSGHMDDYAAALRKLRGMGLIYPCFCTRREFTEEAARAGNAPHLNEVGPDGPVYPGTCRRLSANARAENLLAKQPQSTGAWISRRRAVTGPLMWREQRAGNMQASRRVRRYGVGEEGRAHQLSLKRLGRRSLQGITLVTRGEDLLRATDIHRLLQTLLGYATPHYHHHPLLTDAAGRRFAKRDKALTLRALRAEGKTAEDVRRLTCPQLPHR